MGQQINSFKDLRVWQEGMLLSKKIYQITSVFPVSEFYSITNQMRRAAISIPANIAEGWGRKTPRNFHQFLRNSKGSLFELHTLLILAFDLNYLEQKVFDELILDIERLGKMLNSLIKRLDLTTNNQQQSALLRHPRSAGYQG